MGCKLNKTKSIIKKEVKLKGKHFNKLLKTDDKTF